MLGMLTKGLAGVTTGATMFARSVGDDNPVYYDDDKTAREDVRNGKIQGAVIIPPQYSRRVYEKDRPQIALVVDNSDNFMSSTLEDELTGITNALNQPTVEPRSAARRWSGTTRAS